MPIKRLLEAVGAIIALLCFAIAVRAFLELRQMDRAEKRERERQVREMPDEGIQKFLRRAG